MFDNFKRILSKVSPTIQTPELIIDGTKDFRVFCKEDLDSGEFRRVLNFAQSLREHMNSDEIRSKLAAANALGRSSHEVQACLVNHAKVLGFQSEKRGLFGNYAVNNLRPDYYLRLSSGRGIILEVERGRTLDNNMDLLDLWKCHICEEAQYLFLVVPLIRPNEKGKPTSIFANVAHRLEPFFQKDNYVNVYGVVIFGY